MIAGSSVDIDLDSDWTEDERERYYLEISCDGAYLEYDYTLIENPVDRIEYTGAPLSLYENMEGYWEDGFFYYDYDLTEEHTVRVYYKDGTYADGSVEDGVNGIGFGYSSNQEENHWTVGGNNAITLSYLGATAKLPVEILPIPTLQLNTPETMTIVVDEEKVYQFVPQVSGAYVLTAEIDDGTSGDELYVRIYNEDLGTVESAYGTSIQMCAVLAKGVTYSFEFENDSMEGTFTCTAVLSLAPTSVLPVNTPTSVTVTDGQEQVLTFVPPADGWYAFTSQQEDGDPCMSLYDSQGNYLGHDDDHNGSKNFFLKVKLQAGETYYGLFDDYNDEGNATYKVTVSPAVAATSVKVVTPPTNNTVVEGYGWESCQGYDGLELEFTLSDGSKQLWNEEEYPVIAGSEVVISFCSEWLDEDTERFYLGIYCDDAYLEYDYTVIENPVDRIEYTGDPLCYYENSHGYMNGEYYYYSYDLTEEHTVRVYFKDGTYVDASVEDEVNGVDIEYSEGQWENPWTLGGDNYIILSYLGVTTKLPVNILPAPFNSVTIHSVPNQKYYFGDERWGYMDEDTYYFYPEDLTGLSFTVTFADGTTKTYTDKDINMDNWEIDGYPFDLSGCEITAPGTAQITLSYKGYDIMFPVTVVESPVASIEVIKDATQMEYDSDVYPLLYGMQVKVTFTDGTSSTVTLDENNVLYVSDFHSSGFQYSFDVNGHTVFANYRYDEEMGEYYRFTCEGAAYNYTDFRFVNNLYDVKKITFNGYADGGKVIQLIATLADGSTQNLDVRPVLTREDSQMSWGYAMCQWGIDYFEHYTLMDGNEELWFLGFAIELGESQQKAGDVNGDGKITATDALNVLKIVVGKLNASEAESKCADVNGDGKVTATDALEILKYVVGKPSALG